MEKRSKTYWTLGLIIAAVYVCAFAYISLVDNGVFSDHGYPIQNGGDSYEYALLAHNVAEYGSFSLAPHLNVPEMFRSPGYSFFLVPFYVVDHSLYLAILAQVLLVIGSAFFIYAIGIKFLPPTWAFICALFYALDPTTIFYSLSIFSDTLFVFLLLASVYLLFVKENRGWAEFALSGFVLGFGTLVRTAGEYLIFIIAILALVEAVKRIGWKRALLSSALLIVSAYLVLAPWYTRNFQVSGALGIASTGPYTFLFYHVKDFEMKVKGVSSDTYDNEIKTRLNVTDLQELRNIKYSSGMMGIVKEKIFADPIHYSIYHLLGSVNLFLASGLRDTAINLPILEKTLSNVGLIGTDDVNVKEMFAKNPLGAIWYAVSSEPLFTLERLLRLLGLLLAVGVTLYGIVTRRFSLLFAVLLAIVVYTALVIGPVSYPRYRMPLEPFLYMITALGWLSLVWKGKSTSDKLGKTI